MYLICIISETSFSHENTIVKFILCYLISTSMFVTVQLNRYFNILNKYKNKSFFY